MAQQFIVAAGLDMLSTVKIMEFEITKHYTLYVQTNPIKVPNSILGEF